MARPARYAQGMNNGSTGGNGKTSPFGNGMGAPDRAAQSSSNDFTVNATAGSGGGKGGSSEVERQLTNGGSTPQRTREGGNPKTAAPGGPLPFDQPRSPQRDVGVGGQSNQKPPFKLR